MITYALLAALAIMLASLAGAIFAWKTLGDWLAPRLRYLIALAAGVFVVVIYGLAGEALHDGLSLEVVLAFVAGALFLIVLTALLPKGTHHHHGPHHHTHTPLDARRMMLGDAVHNVHDGLILVPAFLVSPVVGITTTVGVLLHELVQEISEFFVLREAGYSATKALSLNFLVSATILIGVVLSLQLSHVEELGHLLVAFSAGGFTYVLLRDLIPSIIVRARKDSRVLAYAAAFTIGLVVMLLVTLVAPHAHEHEDEEFLIPEGFGLAATQL
jgi:zinc and cadmium transporter